MFVLIKTQPTTESNTFNSVYDLLTHVTQLVTKHASSDVGPQKAEKLPEGTPSGVGPHVVGTLSQAEKSPKPKPKVKQAESTKFFPDLDNYAELINANIAKNEWIQEQVSNHQEHNEEIQARINETKKQTQGPVRPQDIQDIQTFFLEKFCIATPNGTMDRLEIAHAWDLFVSFPHKWLTNEEQSIWIPRLMVITPEGLVGLLVKPTGIYAVRKDMFQDYHALVKHVFTLEGHAALYMNPILRDICLKTQKALYSNAPKPFDLDPWIQYFVDSRLVQRRGLEIQSSVLYQTFMTWMTERVPAFGFASVQHFANRLKTIHGFTTHRKASGNFYEHVGLKPEKEKEKEKEEEFTENEKPLLHENAELPSAWPPSLKDTTELAPPFETQWAEIPPSVDDTPNDEPEKGFENDRNFKIYKATHLYLNSISN